MTSWAWFLVALPLALDVFAVGLVFGLAGLERVRWLSVCLTFAAIGGVMIALGITIGESLSGALGTRAGDAAEIIAGAVFTVLGLIVLDKAFTSRS